MPHVAIFIFDKIEVLDFCGPFEVFSVCRLDEAQRRETSSPFQVSLVAETHQPITTMGGMVVTPKYAFADCPPIDILVIPGGFGVRQQLLMPSVIDWVSSAASQAETITSVCTGAMLLGEAGLLKGKRATTHFSVLDWMRERFPDTQVSADEHVVQEGKVYTSAGISAGIDMALQVVERYYGKALSLATARHMEYRYPTDNSRRS